MKKPDPSGAPVFVDQSGRRSRVLTAAAIGAGVLVVALTVTLVAGIMGDTVLPSLSWPGPGGHPHAVASPSRPVRPTRAPEHRVSTSPAVLPVRNTSPTLHPSPSPSPSPSRQASAPSPSPSRSPQASPSPSPSSPAAATANPGHGGTPPGRLGKTRGTK